MAVFCFWGYQYSLMGVFYNKTIIIRNLSKKFSTWINAETKLWCQFIELPLSAFTCLDKNIYENVACFKRKTQYKWLIWKTQCNIIPMKA